MGGGFDCLRGRLPTGLDASVAMILAVPWPLLEAPYRLQLELADADGAVAGGFRLRAELESTPPAGWREGAPLTVPLVFPVRAELGEPGRYAVRCLIEGEERGQGGVRGGAGCLSGGADAGQSVTPSHHTGSVVSSRGCASPIGTSSARDTVTSCPDMS